MTQTHAFSLMLSLTLAWLILTAVFVWFTREKWVAFAAGSNLALGIIVYANCELGLLELGGLPHVLGFGIIAYLMGRHLQMRSYNPQPQVALNARAAQARRLLRATLLCCGFIWGSAIAFTVLPAPFLLDFLRSLGGPDLKMEGTTEYAVRMALSAFTLIGFFFYFISAKMEESHSTIMALGAFMLLNGVILALIGFHLSPPHPWMFESGSCLFTGVVIFILASIYRAAILPPTQGKDAISAVNDLNG